MKLTRRTRRICHDETTPSGATVADSLGLLIEGDKVKVSGLRGLWRFGGTSTSPDGTVSAWVYGPLPTGRTPKNTKWRAVLAERVQEDAIV